MRVVVVTLTFEVTRVLVLQGNTGPDSVFIHTTGPNPTPGLSSQPLTLEVAVAAGEGLEYTLRLGVPARLVEVIRNT